MTKNKDMQHTGISRRRFLATAGSLSFVITAGAFAPGLLSAQNRQKNDGDEQITAWVRLTADGKITLYNPAAEMGQGSMTALAIIIAEEMDADWANVLIENSPVEPAVYGLQWSGQLGGPMVTAGSRTIRGYYPHLRQAGAQARYILLHNAAEKWGVPIAELTTEPSAVVHAKSGRRLSYGEIAAFVKVPEDLPGISEEEMKKPEDFRLIGHVIPRFDIPGKVNGQLQYSIDIQLPDMVYGAISRSPVHGAKPELLNEADVRETEGLVDIVRLDHGIGVVAETFEQALKAKRKLQIRWSEDAKAQGYNSQEAFDGYAKLVADGGKPGRVVLEDGDSEANLQSAHKVYDRTYKNDFLCHAQMEPLNAVVSVSEDGRSAEAWVGTQAPDRDRAAIARVLELDESQVKVNTLLLGGGFGRRSMDDYSMEAAVLAKQIRRPVKLIWTREDDMQYGAYRPATLQRMQAGVDQEGALVAWRHRIAGPGGHLQAGGSRMAYYTIPNQRVELYATDDGVRTQFWRSVGHGPNKFAQETFLDEMAHDLKIDPYEFRRRLMKDLPRHRTILDKVVEISGWNSSVPEGRARGMAFSDYGGSYTAGVVEISLDRKSGRIRVHRVWAAVDCGVAVQPDNIVAQMEGGIVMGISSVLHESITFRNGKVQQSNFHDYPILRMADAPESIEISIIPSAAPPTSIGEVSLPLMGGAIANAFLKLTGKPLRHMPFSTEKVLDILEG